jgi:hypothetical protein
MTIRNRVATLDDFSGELALALSKLELEAAQGSRNQDEQVDFVRDISRTAFAKEVLPWRSHAVKALLFGLACVAVEGLLPEGLLVGSFRRGLALALIACSLAASLTCMAVYLRRKRLESQWLENQERLIASGRAFLDL